MGDHLGIPGTAGKGSDFKTVRRHLNSDASDYSTGACTSSMLVPESGKATPNDKINSIGDKKLSFKERGKKTC